MRAIVLLLPWALSCAPADSPEADGPEAADGGDGGGDGAGDGGDGGDGGGDGGDGGDGGAPDADNDGWTADEDCQDEDASIHPGAPEVCDGVDQDCDDQVDEGIPNDGDGCQDPGPPEFGPVIDTIHVEVRTGADPYDDSDSPWELCMAGDGHCMQADNLDWDDLEGELVDVFFFEGVDLARADATGFGLRTLDGGDQWEPVCFAVRFDGEAVYCQDGLEMEVGDESDELAEWQDPNGWTLACDTCFDTTLTAGPILGAVDHDSARIWVRASATTAATLRVAAAPEDLADAQPVAWRYPLAKDDFTTTFDVQGLGAQATWFYDVEIAGQRHGPWSFTTAAEPGTPTELRLAFGSCSRDDEQPIFESIIDYAPDVFLFAGDNHYANTNDVGGSRSWYRWAHSRAGRDTLMTTVPTLAIWDDHDYVDNNEDGHASGKSDVLRTFQEYWANASYGTDTIAGTFGVQRMGPVEFILLDDRYYRDLDDSILGDAQEAWALDALAASDAPFKLLVSGSQFTNDGSSDSWAYYDDARERFFEAIMDRGIEGVVLLSGDVHRSELRWIPSTDGGYDFPELTSSPLANTNSGCDDGDDVVACEDTDNYFVGVEVDTQPADPTLSATIFNEAGQALATLDLTLSELRLPTE